MSELKSISLLCQVCGESPHKIKLDKKEFTYVAHEQMVQWSDEKEKHPDLKDDTWKRSDCVPYKGEERMVVARFPFCYGIGESFYTMFYPALAFMNGWESAKEIENTAIVKCRFICVLEKNENSAWIKVKVEEVIMVPDLLKRVSPVECDTYYKKIKSSPDYGKNQVEQYGPWQIHEWSIQGDLGEWALVYEEENGVKHMLLYSYWDFHMEHVYCGNLII